MIGDTMQEMKTYQFYTDNSGWSVIETKDGKKHYITGYISTKDLDKVNDIVTEDCLKDMVMQLNQGNIKLDVEHEAFRDNPNIIPAGRIIESRIDAKGIWVKAELNIDSPKFDNVWGSVKNKFLDAFSIAFRPIKVIKKSAGKAIVRILNQIELLNVALTGNPVNPECLIGQVFTKSILELKSEDDNMAEEEVKETPVVETPAVEEAKVEAPVEAKVETPVAEPVVEAVAEAKVENAEVKALKEQLDKQNEELKALQLSMKKPVLKSKVEDAPSAELKDNMTGTLDLIR